MEDVIQGLIQNKYRRRTSVLMFLHRIWLDGILGQNPLIIETKYTGVGKYNLEATWRLDYILVRVIKNSSFFFF